MEPVSAPALDVGAIAAQFPILRREIGGRPITYLDSAATAQTPEPVLAEMDRIYRESNANIHRGVYALSQESTAAFEGARSTVAEWLGAQYEETIFAKNVTEAINLVAYSWGRRNVGRGDRVLTTKMEHHSNIVPWQLLCAEVGAELRYVDVDEDYRLDLDSLDSELAAGGVKLVCVGHVSNALGTLNPVAEIARRAHDAGALVLVDGAQAIPHMRVDVKEIGADFYGFTGHKVYGPTGIGVLYGRRELLEEMPPFLGGGEMIARVDWEMSTWNSLPWKFEAGTTPYVEAAGLGAAIRWLSSLGIDAVLAHELELTEYLIERLQEVEGLVIRGPLDRPRGTAVSFTLDGIHPHDVAEILARDGICVRAGHHCAQPLMRHMGVPATSRASIGVHNTRADVDRLIDGLAEVRRVFA
ncbi:MAG: cysteine desulfurase / selenocysteine lyase [Thermoleophilaceae bacterium]|nr:cysteine desulfurase / selenocysteine lyase [Thermoleophilaceae bacterium]